MIFNCFRLLKPSYNDIITKMAIAFLNRLKTQFYTCNRLQKRIFFIYNRALLKIFDTDFLSVRWKALNSNRTPQKFRVENAKFQPDTVEIPGGKCEIPAGHDRNSGWKMRNSSRTR
ncbi:hypothetical protein WA1_50635 [Scytonema hofmannii PCC 7110]|uniref:Uncharacterized protein n=1 Tax=Scytonema hofmannii PCC 7110 TaxID=128403 RepID=A0A139WQG9_9CYAN|nr:hypothetical protein [Scytonema hofmannii]KYC34674.1 hypothetical protein WA1_50635 [Scytonema hofmannii PCC 7110]